MTLVDILKRSARKYPHETAVTIKRGFRTLNLTYKELYDLSKKVALFLKDHGVKNGDNVVLLAPNSPFWVAVYFGALMRGACIVPLNIQSTRDFVLRALKQTGARVFFKYQLFKHSLPKNMTVVDTDFLDEIVADYKPSHYKMAKIKEDDIAQILYTSGTTGMPKGVMLTHKNIGSNVKTVASLIHPESGRDRLLSVLPLSHILEQTIGLLLPIYKGVQIVYAHSPAMIAELMKKYRITKMVAVPEFLQVIRSRILNAVHQAKKEKRFDFLLTISRKLQWHWFSRLLCHSILRQFGGRIDTMASGGAPLDSELEEWWNDLGIVILQGYGLTETSPVVTTNTYEVHRLGSVGKTIKDVDVKIAKDGELWVKGPNVFKGYYKNLQQTKKTFNGKWFKTGDIGKFDENEFLFLQGRKKYMILGPGGQNVFPEDLEEKLNRLKGVKDSAVLGLDLPGGNVEIHAVLLLSDKAPKPEKIIEITNEQLASYQQVTGWTVWPDEDFPRSATRKVKKEKVREYLEAGRKKNGKSIQDISPLVRLLSQVSHMPLKNIHLRCRLIRDLQLDSLRRVELLSRIEVDFRVVLDESAITSRTTVKQLQEMINQGTQVKPHPQLSHWPCSWWASIVRVILQQIFFLISRVFLHVKVKGLENLKEIKGFPVIFMPNHLSNWDAVAVCRALPFKVEKNLSFAAAQDTVYKYYKKFAWLVELGFNSFPLPRHEGDNIKAGLENSGQMLDRGFNVVMYPEGKISEQGDLLPLKEGAGLFATQMGVPVVPIKIEGMQKVFPYCVLFPRSIGTVTVTIGKPMVFSRRESYKEATRKIHKALTDL